MSSKKHYDVYLLLASPSARRLWEKGAWLPLSRLLDGFVTDRPGVLVEQVDRVRRRARRLGSLEWNRESFETWTLAPHDDSILFERLRLSFPDTTDFEVGPDAYFEVVAPYKPTYFAQAILMAVSGDGFGDLVRDVVSYLLREGVPVVSATTQRDFSYRSGAALVRSLDYLIHEEILELDRGGEAPSVQRLNEESESMSLRTGVSVPPWEPLDAPTDRPLSS